MLSSTKPPHRELSRQNCAQCTAVRPAPPSPRIVLILSTEGVLNFCLGSAPEKLSKGALQGLGVFVGVTLSRKVGKGLVVDGCVCGVVDGTCVDVVLLAVARGCVGGLVAGVLVTLVDKAGAAVRTDAAPHSHTPNASFLVPPVTPARTSCLVWPA